ncbi:glyoxylate/hydroxypyruvate reductase A [Rhizobium sp. Root274]|uniref:2-hydroxyacid dehydrogenase n=1 Tax=unclassified Rhizobium TaxID=2613769 RepID=UPI000714BBFB|nr:MULTISPECIES: glyoxylate/hydroxypyruvate reductase A [unclassified Rhizobium]KQW32203.1 glyoxylate/hydroxypyruvate reductase A [Rhizobium sp. Root1240]KRD33744.1 glyoxylate/hydroxypyruvate reductase A [Rhizobium sp. Root274]
MPDKSPIIIDLRFDRDSVLRALPEAFAGRQVIDLGDPANRDRDLSEAAYAVVWKPDPDLFRRASGLKAIFSGGAGVDHILSNYQLPDLPIVRFVDRSLTDRMSEWVVWQCLHHLRNGFTYAEQQRTHVWNEIAAQPEARDVTVGIMGLGVLGADAAAKLKAMGFRVIGWSRSKKEIDGIETFSAGGLDEFLGRTDILVGLLPLTDDTRGIYDKALFSKLSRVGALGGPVFLNAGRGGSQNEADLVACLTDGTLKAASLDVFVNEPLGPDSPLWTLPNVLVTPHAAASSEVRALFRHVEQQIDRLEAGKPLQFVVDRTSGY